MARELGELDLRNAILFLEDRDFHEWVRGEVVPALRHRKNFEVQGEYTPGAAAALKGSIRELQLALEQQRRELELALLSRGEALHEALRALAERRKSMYPLMDAVAACRSVAEPTVLFGSAHYASAKWPPPERRANYAEAKDWTPASAFLKGKLEPRAAARCLHVFEAVIYARMCATRDERGFKYVSHNCRIAPLYDERILQETFAECRAHFEDAGGGDNWRVSAAAFWQGRTWRHAQAARGYLAALRFPTLVLAKNRRQEPDLALADELYWPMLCAIERRLGLASYERPDVRDGLVRER